MRKVPTVDNEFNYCTVHEDHEGMRLMILTVQERKEISIKSVTNVLSEKQRARLERKGLMGEHSRSRIVQATK